LLAFAVSECSLFYFIFFLKIVSLCFFLKEPSKRTKRYSIVAISDALTDYIVYVSEEQFASTKLIKGASLVMNDEIREHISRFYEDPSTFKKFAGGSAVNTIQGASNIGLKCSYIGCVGNDEVY
jgi:hypothetical protein